MLQLVILAVVIYILARWLRAGTPPRRSPRGAQPPPSASAPPVEEMVQDPVCGVWLPASQAVALERGGENLRFCSAACRDAYLRKGKAE